MKITTKDIFTQNLTNNRPSGLKDFKMKKVYSHRLTSELIEKARAEGIDITKSIEAMLARALKYKKCPYCGQAKKVGE